VNEFIRYLAEQFPKCFFEDPAQRRPLKRDIIDDLEKRKVLNSEKLLCALDWYKNHFTYRYTIIAGAERVDLDGQRAGTVTVREQQEARACRPRRPTGRNGDRKRTTRSPRVDSSTQTRTERAADGHTSRRPTLGRR
jgi:sRNA-binding protein